MIHNKTWQKLVLNPVIGMVRVGIVVRVFVPIPRDIPFRPGTTMSGPSRGNLSRTARPRSESEIFVVEYKYYNNLAIKKM